MSIGKKIALGFGLSLLVLLAIALVAFQGAQQLVQTTEKLVESRDQARSVREVRLLRASEMRDLFPDGELERERIGPLTKSFTSVGGR